jgi:hypothetical protein
MDRTHGVAATLHSEQDLAATARPATHSPQRMVDTPLLNGPDGDSLAGASAEATGLSEICLPALLFRPGPSVAQAFPFERPG